MSFVGRLIAAKDNPKNCTLLLDNEMFLIRSFMIQLLYQVISHLFIQSSGQTL